MSEENKASDLNSQAKELGRQMFESFEQARKEAEEAEAKAKAEKEKAAQEAVSKTADKAAVSHAMNSAYGISESTFDKTIAKDFSPENVKQFVGKQNDADRIAMKTNLFFRALVGAKLYPHIQEFGYTLKALSEGTDADGGYLVDPEYRGEVLRQLHHEGIMRPEVNVIPTSKDSVDFNYEDGRPTTTWGSENTTITTTTASLARKTISVHRLNTLMYMSREVVADSDPSITEWIRAEMTTAMRLAEDAAIIGGSGSGQPQGITGVTFQTVAAGSGLTFEDYLDLMFKLPVQYRNLQNVKWFMSSNALRDAMKLKDDQGMPIYVRDLSANGPGTLLGKPIVLHDNFGDSNIFFGDLKRTYTLLDRQQIAVETTTEGGDTFAKHQVGIKITERIGGDVIRSEALVEGTGFSA